MRDKIQEEIFSIKTQEDFEKLSIEIFNYQAENNPVYSNFIRMLGREPGAVKSLLDIPFLPVEFFRNHIIKTGNMPARVVFESSGTTGMQASRHYVSDLKVYERSFLTCFSRFYGDPGEYFFAALLPSYLERANSSLVYMAERLIKKSNDSRSSFFLNDPERLVKVLKQVKKEKRKAMVIGVSFALLDLAEKFRCDLSGITVVETGGMKGRRKEITREELHLVLKQRMNLDTIHSEYGMTELLSQAWSDGGGLFNCPPWMKIVVREINDPLTVFDLPGKAGGINIIDLANINSCSFLATGDVGKLHENGRFEVSGRFDNSDLRGCNLLLS
jgi:phenylacetate-coenzyme A ligase PaaK-like adenylate-forming protein